MYLLCYGIPRIPPRLTPLFISTAPLKFGSMGEYSMQ